MVGASEGMAARAASFSEAMRGLSERRCELRAASLPLLFMPELISSSLLCNFAPEHLIFTPLFYV